MQVVSIDPRSALFGDTARLTFSLALSLDGDVLLAGATGATYDAAAGHVTVASDVTGQVRVALSKVDELLRSAGLQHSDIVLVTEYVTPEGLAHHAEIAAVRQEILTNCQPTVRRVCVRSLVRPDAHVEIEVVAHAPRQTPASNRGGLSDLVYPPTCYAMPDGGDAERQAYTMFRQAKDSLDRAGLSPAHVARMLVYATTPNDDGAQVIASVCRRVLSTEVPEPDVICVDTLGIAGASMQVNITASRVPVFRSELGVRAGRLLFPPLLTAPEADGVVAQLEAIYRRVGGAQPRLLHTVEYIRPEALIDYRRTAAVRSALLRRPFPTATGVVCAGVGEEAALIGVEAIAASID